MTCINKNTDGAVYFYVYNLQGDVVQLLDSSRNIVGEYVYGPYGYIENHSSLTTIARANPFRYRGYYYDTENGYYYLNARYYYPVFGRFISADEVEISTLDNKALSDKNLFVYCDDNPITRTDDGGQFWHLIIGGAVGAVIGFASSITESLMDHGSMTKEDWACACVGLGFGAINGVLTSSGAGAVFQVALGAALSGTQTNIEQKIRKEDTNIKEIAFDAVVGGVMGASGGISKGNSKHLMRQGINATRRVIHGEAKKAVKYYFTQTAKMFYKPLLKSSVKDFVSGCITNKIKMSLV